MSKGKQLNQDKITALRCSGTLNPFPEKVQDPHFQNEEFFDPSPSFLVILRTSRNYLKKRHLRLSYSLPKTQISSLSNPKIAIKRF